MKVGRRRGGKEALYRHIHGRRNAMWEFGAQHMKNCVYCVTRGRGLYIKAAKNKHTQKRAAISFSLLCLSNSHSLSLEYAF